MRDCKLHNDFMFLFQHSLTKRDPSGLGKFKTITSVRGYVVKA